jgi:hypothetical protein
MECNPNRVAYLPASMFFYEFMFVQLICLIYYAWKVSQSAVAKKISALENEISNLNFRHKEATKMGNIDRMNQLGKIRTQAETDLASQVAAKRERQMSDYTVPTLSARIVLCVAGLFFVFIVGSMNCDNWFQLMDTHCLGTNNRTFAWICLLCVLNYAASCLIIYRVDPGAMYTMMFHILVIVCQGGYLLEYAGIKVFPK